MRLPADSAHRKANVAVESVPRSVFRIEVVAVRLIPVRTATVHVARPERRRPEVTLLALIVGAVPALNASGY